MNKLILFVILFINFSIGSYQIHRKIPLRDVEVLTFKNGLMTTGRRSSPVRQMQCIGGSAKIDSYKLDTIQCKNVGYDRNDVNWKCETVLSDHYKLGKTEVSCEGFDYPDDPYILVGSCGIEYELDYTQKYYDWLRSSNDQQTTTKTTKTTTYKVENHPEYNAPDFPIIIILFVILGFSLALCST